MKFAFRKFTDWLIPEPLRRDREVRRQCVRLIVFDVVPLLWIPVYTAIVLAFDAPWSACWLVALGVGLAGNLWVLRWKHDPILCGSLIPPMGWTVLTALIWLNGGHESPVQMWYVALPVFGLMLVGLRTGMLWAFVCATSIVAFYLAEELGIPFPSELSREGLSFVQFSGLLGLLTCIFVPTLGFRQVELEARRAIRDALEQATAADRAKSEFLANMSHEIRTPMTAILGFTDALLDADFDVEESRDAVVTIKRNGEHLLRIINDILDLSKIEAGKLEIEPRPCAPRQLAGGALLLLRNQAEDKGLACVLRCDEALPPAVVIDHQRVRQILINLVGNAIKFTEQGTVCLEVRWLPHEGAVSEIAFEVWDTGVGMTAEQISRLFHPFTQVDNSLSRKFGGTGLGLAISRRLAELLGGNITVTSRPGEGSTFRLVVPAPRALVDSLEAADRGPLTGEIIGGPRLSLLVGCRLLLAEDAIDNQRLISHLLRREGAELTIVPEGQSAYDCALEAAAAGTPFDVILMDMQMPGVDGYEATRRLRAAGYDRPIIALTAHSMGSDRQKCLDAGCDDYAAKPIQKARLIAMIAQYRAYASSSCTTRP